MDDSKRWLEKRIGDIVSENIGDFILYPFGYRGEQIKAILNAKYGIREKAIIDNVLCDTYKCIYNLEYLRQMDLDNCKILITSDNVEIYEELREELYSVVEKEQCIEVFYVVPPIIEVKRRREEVLKKMKREGIAPVYHPTKTNSKFYLPFLFYDYIQRLIFLTDDYFERKKLDYVFKTFKNGIIGDKISQEEGIVLDIGANIGNHTLFFCNEYNAKKVYCFEPIEETFFILAENIMLNHLEDRVILNSFGLGGKDENASAVSYDIFNIGGTMLKQNVNGKLKIKKLDGIGIELSVAFIKIDVEGMELEVIKGGIALIKKNRPYIMVESFPEAFPEVREILCGIGYAYENLGLSDWIFYPA